MRSNGQVAFFAEKLILCSHYRRCSTRRLLKKCRRISNAHAARLHPGLLRSSRAYCTNTRAPVLGGPGAFGPPGRPTSRRHSSTASQTLPARVEQDVGFASQVPVVAPGSPCTSKGAAGAVACACGVHRLVLGACPTIERPLDCELDQLPPLSLG